MAIIYPPYIEGTIPAFGPILKIPFEWNPGVSPAEVSRITVKILDLNNKPVGLLHKKFAEDKKIYEIDFETKDIDLIQYQYYKFQLAYADTEDPLENEQLIYSSVGIGKYFGTFAPTIDFNAVTETQCKYQLVFNSKKDSVDSKEKPYQTTIEFYSNSEPTKLIATKEIIFDEYNKATFYYFNKSAVKIIIKCSTINNYSFTITKTINEKDITDNDDFITVMAYDNPSFSANIQQLYGNIVISATKAVGQDKIAICKYENECKYNIIGIIDSTNNYVTDWCINSYEPNHYAAFYLTQDKTLSNVTGRLDYNNMSLKGADGKILNIEYNPKISSFKTTLQEQKIDTIGGKYPIFQRNGNLAYKEFQISGLISYWMDENDSFISKTELGLDNEDNFKTTNLTGYNIAAERKFRLAVLDWLNDGQVKIFRSPTEGLYMIRLMNISLSPDDKLGRMLYTFSATAYEIAELNYENLVKYGFEKISGDVDYVL